MVDFTPSINASAQSKAVMGQIDKQTLDLLLVDPTMGYVGLGVSVTIWLGAFFYSRQLVSAIWGSQITSDEGDDDVLLAVSTLKFPFLTQPTILRKLVYDPETNHFDGGAEAVKFTNTEVLSTANIYLTGELVLSEDKKKQDAIVKFDGDFSRLRGFVALKKEDYNRKSGPLASVLQQKYLIEISSADEMMPGANSFLMRALVMNNYPLENGSKEERHGSTKSRITAGRVGMKRKTGRNSTEKQRPISQLEMDRMKRKQ